MSEAMVETLTIAGGLLIIGGLLAWMRPRLRRMNHPEPQPQLTGLAARTAARLAAKQADERRMKTGMAAGMAAAAIAASLTQEAARQFQATNDWVAGKKDY